jgi:hypothetical protein
LPLPPKKWLEEFEGIACEAEEARNLAKEAMIEAFRLTEAFVQSLLDSD